MPFDGFDTTQNVQVDYSQLRYALEHDEETFIQFFLGDELTFPVPGFHKTVFRQMTDIAIPQYVCAIPRDHAKTTLAKLAVIWYLLFSKYRFVVYVSNTATIAQNACQDIYTFLTSDNFKAVFGEAEWHIRREGEGFYKFTLHLETTDPETGAKVTRPKTCIIKAQGAGQQVRGLNIDNQRPDVAIVDDLEDNDNIATEELFNKLKKWFYGPFRKALDKFGHKIVHIGNMISNRCLLKEHCESPFWHSMRYGCLLSDGSPLWPDAWSVEKLRQDFNEYLNAGMIDIWMAEMMNLPILMGRGLIKPGEIIYKPVPTSIEYGFITVDLASSRETWAHKTGIAVHGWVDDHWQIVHIDERKEWNNDPVGLFFEIVRLCFEWRVNFVGIESVAYQAALKPIYEYLAIMHRIEGINFIGLQNTITRKVQRLASWAGMIKRGEYALNQGDFLLTEQLLSFDPKKKENEDDAIDACASGIQMIDEFLPEIMEGFVLTSASARFNSDIAA